MAEGCDFEQGPSDVEVLLLWLPRTIWKLIDTVMSTPYLHYYTVAATMVCLILHQRHERRYAQYESLLNLDDADDIRSRSPRGSPRSSRVDAPKLSE